MLIKITQYMRPNGRRIPRTMEVPNKLKKQYELILSCGCELTCEQLMSREAVQYISNANGDFAIETTPAGDLKAADAAIQQLIKAFDKDLFEKWNAQFTTDGKVGLTDKEVEAATVKLPQEVMRLGPTGEFPDGKCYPDDKGELTLGMAVDVANNLIVLNFGVPVVYLAMGPEQATALADDLLRKVQTLTGDEDVVKRV